MPLLPASLIEPLWVEFAALIGSDQRPVFAPHHPWAARTAPCDRGGLALDGDVRGVRRFWHPQVIEHMRRARWQPVPPGPGSHAS